MPAFGVFLVRIFPHLDWIRRFMEYLSVSSPSWGKYGPEKLWIRTRFTQWDLTVLCCDYQTSLDVSQSSSGRLILFILLFFWIIMGCFLMAYSEINHCSPMSTSGLEHYYKRHLPRTFPLESFLEQSLSLWQLCDCFWELFSQKKV